MVGVIIPVRLASSRLPRKALRLIHGKSVIQRCYEGCLGSGLDVYVATPDEEIADLVESFGGQVIMSGKCPTALDRCSEAVEQLIVAGYETAVVVQGDEPMVRHEMIDLALRGNQEATCLVKKLSVDEDPHDPNMLKVLFDKRGRFIYLSRSVLPGIAPHKGGRPPIYKQVMVMAFEVHLLAQYKLLQRGPIEMSEDIEILRYIEHGYDCIRSVESPYETQSVDTLKDLNKIREMMKVE